MNRDHFQLPGAHFDAEATPHLAPGHIEEWFYAGLAGIEADSEHIATKPQIVGDLTWVNAWYEALQGRIESNWKKDNAGFELTLRIPANALAMVYLPSHSAEQVTESGRPISDSQGAHFLRQEGSTMVLEVASGQYSFRVPRP